MEKLSLEMFVEPTELSFDSLIRRFIDEKRLKKARRIKDHEIAIKTVSKDRIEASIRATTY